MPFKAIRDFQTYAILGAAMEVHGCLGCGFPEAPYAEALAREFAERGVPYRSEVRFEIPYKGKPLKSYYRADFVGYDLVIVELNFGSTSLQHRRLVRNLIESA